MGGEGVAQGVDAPLFADAGAEFRHRGDLLRDGDVDRTRALAIGEDPDPRGRGPPIHPEVVEHPLGQRHVAVLGALALFHAQGHAVGIDVGDLERDHLTDPQAGRVGHRQQQPVPRVRARVE